uniref:atherin-like n=1 Tax=Odobenus rosmarus divergens TaxID=9708 RepID=UPI00063CD8C9|nr:PREDICTED: atherin-like [Odobenus rosmarus divergens]
MPPTASPAALSSSPHCRLWEASRYLLSSLPGVGILKLSPSRPGGGPSFSSPGGTETPPARHQPGAVDSGSAPRSGAGRRNLPARRRSRSSRVAVSCAAAAASPSSRFPPPTPAAVSCAALFRAWERRGRHRLSALISLFPRPQGDRRAGQRVPNPGPPVESSGSPGPPRGRQEVTATRHMPKFPLSGRGPLRLDQRDPARFRARGLRPPAARNAGTVL